jgi:hypothetical protein
MRRIGRVKLVNNGVNHDCLLGNSEGTVGRYGNPIVCKQERNDMILAFCVLLSFFKKKRVRTAFKSQGFTGDKHNI